MQLVNILIILTATMWAVAAATSFAQEAKKKFSKVTVKTVGSLAVRYYAGSESVFLNFGGPQGRFDYKESGASYGMFPSLRFFYGY